jgi:hypothetical protein
MEFFYDIPASSNSGARRDAYLGNTMFHKQRLAGFGTSKGRIVQKQAFGSLTDRIHIK